MKPYFPAYTQFASVTDTHDPYLIIDHPVKGTSVKIKLSDFSPKLVDAIIASLGGTANRILRTDASGDLILSKYPIPYGTAAGTDTYTSTLAPAIDAYETGVPFFIKFTNANTGASTLNLNGLGAKSLVKSAATALANKDIISGKYYLAVYDGTNIQLSMEEETVPYGAATGTDTYAVTVTPAFLAYETGRPFRVQFANANTGAATLDVSGLGAKSLVKSASTALAARDIVVGKIYDAVYDGTNIQLDIEGVMPYGAATGTDTYAVTVVPASFTAYETGRPFRVKFANANTGASTLDVNGLGAKSLVKGASTALVRADIIPDKIYDAVYDGTNIQLDIEVSEWTTATVAITSPQLLGIGTTPKVLLAAPAAGTYYEIESIRLEFTYGTAQYTAATATYLNVIDNSNPGGSYIANVPVVGGDGLVGGNIDTFVIFRPNNNTYYDAVLGTNYSLASALGLGDIVLSTDDSSDLAAGDGTIRAIIRYKTYTFGA